jgi:cell shape-determining protein MreD
MQRIGWLLVLLIAAYLAAVAETALVDAMRIGQVTPDLLALVALVWALTAAGPRAFLAAGAVMFLGDLIAPGRVGLGTGWMLLVAFGVGQLRARVRLENLAAQLGVLLAGATLWAAGVGLSARLLGNVALPWSTVLARAGGVGLYTAGVGLPLLMVLGWIRQPRLARERRLEPA